MERVPLEDKKVKVAIDALLKKRLKLIDTPEGYTAQLGDSAIVNMNVRIALRREKGGGGEGEGGKGTVDDTQRERGCHVFVGMRTPGGPHTSYISYHPSPCLCPSLFCTGLPDAV